MTNLQIVKGKVYGSLEGKTVRKYVHKSKHLFRKWDSWGLDCDFFDDMVNKGAEVLEILDKEDNLKYTIGMDAEWAGFRRDWGWGEQYFIPRKYFKVEDIRK
jgi:hypothetical protein